MLKFWNRTGKLWKAKAGWFLIITGAVGGVIWKPVGETLIATKVSVNPRNLDEAYASLKYLIWARDVNQTWALLCLTLVLVGIIILVTAQEDVHQKKFEEITTMLKESSTRHDIWRD